MQVIDSEGYLKVKLIGGPAGPFVPYTGATGNVDLGEYEIKVGQLELDQTPTGTAGVAVMRWNDADGTADLGLKGGNVTLQIGQEQVTRVVNKTGVNLLEANYQAVRVDGAQGNRLKVALAQANNDANSADTLGLVTETINNNQEGFVTVSGLVRNINTTGSIQTETWLDGDVLYLSGTVAGQITNIKPAAPIHTVIMGYVVRAHATQGQIYVKVDNGYELDELHNVAITTPLNNQVLQYETATSLWKNKTISTGITIGTTAITSGTVGRVLFEGTGNVVQESANLFWDNTTKQLRLGATGSAGNIQLLRTSDGLEVGGIRADNSGTQVGGSGYTSNILFGNGGTMQFFASGEKMRIFTTGNIGINITTDAGFKLDVNGTARVQTSLAVTTGKTFSPYQSGSLANDALKITASNDGAVFGVQNSSAIGFSGIEYLNAAGASQVFTGFNNNNNQEFRFNNVASGGYIDFRIGGTSGLRIFNSRNVGINTTTDIASAQLQVESTTKGFLPPRMTTTQKNAIASPAAGLMVYDTTLNVITYYNGTTWI